MNVQLDVGDDGIAVLTMTRPAKLNALNAETLGELDAMLDRIAADPGVRAVIVTGAGDKAFVAGADIGEIGAAGPAAAVDLARRGQAVFRKLETLGKPSIAAINGFALGGGLELAMACTLRVASPNASMGQPEVKLGIIAGYGGTQRLPRLVGRGRALELLLTGDRIDAAKAEQWGLVNAVVAPEELIEYCKALLARMLANAPVALKLTMDAVDFGMNAGLEEGLRYEASGFGVAASTEDSREGTRAFLEKRPATFKGQ